MPKKVCRAAANKMTNKKSNVTVSTKTDKVVSLKERENGKAKTVTSKDTLEQMRKTLDEQIEKFQAKAKLIANRELFETKRNSLIEYMQEEGADFEESLDSRNLTLILRDNNRYSEGIKISNNLVINQVLKVVIVTINQKIQELEKEIIS